MKTKVILNEWDGDRSSDIGGFEIEVIAGGETATIRCKSYNTPKERTDALASARKRAEKVADDIGVEVEEDLYD